MSNWQKLADQKTNQNKVGSHLNQPAVILNFSRHKKKYTYTVLQLNLDELIFKHFIL